MYKAVRRRAPRRARRFKSVVPYRRRKPVMRKRTMFTRGATMPLGKKKFVWKTRYYQHDLSVNPGVGGTTGVHVFSANSLYDPDKTGVGHQPLGFDELVGIMYDHYTVIGAQIRVIFWNSDTVFAQQAGITVQDNASPSADPRMYVENSGNVYTLLAPHDTGSSIKTLTSHVNVGKFLGRPHPLSEDDLRGDVGNDPTEQVYFHVWACPLGGVDASPVSFTVQIDYIAILTEPKKLTLS